ncbi:MAG: PASTA domain-containing protein [Bacteroidetes bacterium]|nr:PASTA domain-containing protein [Bacteroidota bacterium]
MPEYSGRHAPPEQGQGFWSFISSRIFWVNVLAALGAVLVLSLIALQLLRMYTGHNHYITVPDCQGLTLDQAVETLERRDLRVEVMDSLYDPALLPLSVMGQYPAEGAEVKEGRVIHLTVNKTRPQMVDVPVAEVLEKTLRSVQFNLQSKGFRIGELIYRPGVYDNQVVELRKGGTSRPLSRGAKLPKGATIDLVVTDGYGNSRIALPDFTGMSLQEAQFVLTANNLVEGSFVVDAGVDSVSARVYRQEPEAGEDIFVREGSMINLWLGDMPSETFP